MRAATSRRPGPGERTDHHRRGDDTLLTDANGKSAISYDDFAIAMIDEIERPPHARARMTVAY